VVEFAHQSDLWHVAAPAGSYGKNYAVEYLLRDAEQLSGSLQVAFGER
jgi:hypothetical protein